MQNFTRLLLISFLLFSCSKQNESPGDPSGRPPQPTPPKTETPTTKLTIMINDTAMNIASLSYERHGSGTGGGMTITASNAIQKVTAVVFNFYQNSPWDMIYQEEVSYFTRADSLGDWGGTYTRPIPRDDGVTFDNFTPLADSVVTGLFSASFNKGGVIKGEGGQPSITIKGNFKLVFVK